MAKQKRMDQIKTLLRNYLASGSIKATARQLKVSKNTVREYIRRAEAYSADLSVLLELDEEVLSRIIHAPTGDQAEKRLTVFEQKIDYWIGELRRVGVTRELLWQEYRATHADGYGYSQFCEHLRRQVAHRDLTLALDHEPGEVLMVDFTGKKMHWVDPHSGEEHACEVLVAVLPFSQYSFCIALPSQSLADFIEGLNQALLFLGALPKVLLSDNLKAYVSKPDRYEPTFTQLCEQLGAHYQLDLQSTRVATPKDKASVENGVTQVYRRIYAPLRNEIYHSPEALNEAIRGGNYFSTTRSLIKRKAGQGNPFTSSTSCLKCSHCRLTCLRSKRSRVQKSSATIMSFWARKRTSIPYPGSMPANRPKYSTPATPSKSMWPKNASPPISACLCAGPNTATRPAKSTCPATTWNGKKHKAMMLLTSWSRPGSLARLPNGPCSKCSWAVSTKHRHTIVARASSNWLKNTRQSDSNKPQNVAKPSKRPPTTCSNESSNSSSSRPKNSPHNSASAYMRTSGARNIINNALKIEKHQV